MIKLLPGFSISTILEVKNLWTQYAQFVKFCISFQFLGLNSCVVIFCCTSFMSFSSSIDGLWIILLQKKLHSCFCCLWIPAEDDVKPVTHWLALDIRKSAGIHLLQQALHHLVRALNKNHKTKHTLLFWHPIHFTREDIQKITSWWIHCWILDQILKGLCQSGAENLRFYDFGISDFGTCKGGWVTYFFVTDLVFWASLSVKWYQEG